MIDPATDARLADLERKLGHAHRIRDLAVRADDAITALNNAAAEANETAVQARVDAALAHLRAVEVAAGREIEKLKADQKAVRGW